MKIYTKTGDSGTSSLYSGERRSKSDVVFGALGDVDELNSSIGIAREHIKNTIRELEKCQSGSDVENNKKICSLKVEEELEEIQSRLLDAGSAIATPLNSSNTPSAKINRVAFAPYHVDTLETWIDQHASTLPPLKNFILPSGGLASSHLHLARTICRRAERSSVPLAHEGHIPDIVVVYLNRLSDYLFTVARICAKNENQPEVLYKKAP